MATDAERVFAVISRVRNVMFRHANGPIHAAGLTVTQFEVLEALSAHGPLSVGQVSDAIFGTPGNVPVVISNLTRDGLVSRHKSEQDGRVCIVELTPRGREIIEQLYPQVVKSLGHDLEPLSADEKEQVRVLLRKVLDAANAAEGRKL